MEDNSYGDVTPSNQIFEFNNEYETKLASTVAEAVKLIEVGFKYITETDGKKLFRKRK